MVKHLIVVSGPGQRLMLDVAQGAVRSAAATGDDYTYLEVKPAPLAAPAPVQAGAPDPEPPRPWDITMGFVVGLPAGVDPSTLTNATKVKGPLSFADLAAHLDKVPERGRTVLLLRSGPGE
ncbi:MAG TPA: hypothetical protein VFW13_15040 [Phenylobacterium sp.]|nr:hypothetical protein [Phenylobacterium sp.]